MDVVDICALVSNAINVCIIFPALLYVLMTFYKHSEQQLMRYRNRHLVYIINVHVIMMIFIHFAWMSTVGVWQILPIPSWTVSIPIAIGVNSLYMLLALKIYLLYYEQQYNLSIIHKTYHQEYNKWFILQRNRWGNLWYIFAVSFIPYIAITTVLCSIMHYGLFGHPIFDATQAVLVSFQLVFSLHIYIKVPYIFYRLQISEKRKISVSIISENNM